MSVLELRRFLFFETVAYNSSIENLNESKDFMLASIMKGISMYSWKVISVRLSLSLSLLVHLFCDVG